MHLSSRGSIGVTRCREHGPVHDDSFAEQFADRTQLAIARTLPVPFAAAIAAAVGLAPPVMPIERRWQRDATGPFERSDLAAARACGRLIVGRRRIPVEIELAPWSEHTTELVVRPDVRAPHRWSGRRRRTWYAHAHAAADALRQQLLDAQPAIYRPRRVAERLVERRRLAG
jgi:hypothetical protein